MSALTDVFTSIANALRAKTGKSAGILPTDMADEVTVVYNAGVTAGTTAAKVGTATAGDVLLGKTFTNSTTVGESGSMTNNGAVSVTLDTTTASYTVPQGYHSGSGTVSISAQAKSTSSSTSAQTITPDTGKVLSSVSISAISPQRSNGVSSTLTGQDTTGPYVYFPYGWYPQNNSTYGSYCRMTAAQAVTACPSQTKTATPTTRSASAVTVSPDSGKLLSSVTVNTNSVPNSNSGTYTYPAGSTGATYDMGATNTIQYVNAENVYAAGQAAGGSGKYTIKTGTAQVITGQSGATLYNKTFAHGCGTTPTYVFATLYAKRTQSTYSVWYTIVCASSGLENETIYETLMLNNITRLYTKGIYYNPGTGSMVEVTGDNQVWLEVDATNVKIKASHSNGIKLGSAVSGTIVLFLLRRPYINYQV